MDLATYESQLCRDLTLPAEALTRMAQSFKEAMSAGLAGRTSSLKMLPSFLALPTGAEKGRVIAVDFGGTNVRVLEAELTGRGEVKIEQMRRFPLVDPAAGYDYMSGSADASHLFGFIAARVGEIARPGVDYPLGHTFSFPCEQTGVNKARLIVWTKEFKTRGVEGQDIGALFDAALARAGVGHVKGRAIINDTVGTLLAAAYLKRDVDIASICGTGHNTCYLEPSFPATGKPMIVNMESGNFDQVPQTRFDIALDRASERPGAQKLEKMVSGYYLGEIVRHILADMATQGVLPKSAKLGQVLALKGMDLDHILSAKGELHRVSEVAQRCLGLEDLSKVQLQAIQNMVQLVARRSARLVAATFFGTLLHTDAGLAREHTVAIDGSLYEKLPGYAGWLQEALDELAPKGRVTTMLSKDGSGIGAAIAAGMTGTA